MRRTVRAHPGHPRSQVGFPEAEIACPSVPQGNAPFVAVPAAMKFHNSSILEHQLAGRAVAARTLKHWHLEYFGR